LNDFLGLFFVGTLYSGFGFSCKAEDDFFAALFSAFVSASSSTVKVRLAFCFLEEWRRNGLEDVVDCCKLSVSGTWLNIVDFGCSKGVCIDSTDGVVIIGEDRDFGGV